VSPFKQYFIALVVNNIVMCYNTYSSYLRERFGSRVLKLPVDGGFTCPNRDGQLGTGGCTFCSNEAFCPSYCRQTENITAQLDAGIRFQRHRRRPDTCYLAYFQSYSGTYAPIHVLRERYEEALQHPDVVGIVVSTRPDCVDDTILELLASYTDNYYVAVEFGIESCYDRTLALVRRGHDFACTQHAVRAAAQKGLEVGGHLILGLPGESRDDILGEAHLLNGLPLTSLKLHQLQILRGTEMERQYHEEEPFRRSLPLFSADEYVALVCDLLERLRPDLVIERLAAEVPPRYQAIPERGFRHPDGHPVRNEDIPALVTAEFVRRGTRQGSLFVQ